MQIERLEELKQKLTSENDFSQIWNFYMDNFADHAEFTDLGHPAKNKYLDTVVRKTCQEMFGNKMKITDFLLIQIAKYKFFHGPFQVDGRIGGVIYFQDINIGLLAVSADFSLNGMVKYSRFSEMARLSEPKGFSLN